MMRAPSVIADTSPRIVWNQIERLGHGRDRPGLIYDEQALTDAMIDVGFDVGSSV